MAEMSFKTINSNRNIGEHTLNQVVITVPADDLAPLGANGARSSAGTVITKFGLKFVQD